MGTHPATSSSSNTMLETFIHAAPSSALSSLPYGHSQHVTFRTLSQGQPFWRMASGKEVIPSSPASQLYLPHFSSKQHVLRYPKVSPRINTSIYLRSRTIWKSGGQMSYSLRAEGSFPPCPTTPRELAELPAGRKQAALWAGNSALTEPSTIHHGEPVSWVSQPSWPLNLPLLGYLPGTNSLKLTLLSPVPELAIISQAYKSP